jgi:hypothetical protein
LGKPAGSDEFLDTRPHAPVFTHDRKCPLGLAMQTIHCVSGGPAKPAGLPVRRRQTGVLP